MTRPLSQQRPSTKQCPGLSACWHEWPTQVGIRQEKETSQSAFCEQKQAREASTQAPEPSHWSVVHARPSWLQKAPCGRDEWPVHCAELPLQLRLALHCEKARAHVTLRP